MRPGKASLVIPVLLALLPALALAAQPDRITAPLDSAQLTALRGNVHGLARPQFDLGRTDGSKLLSGVSMSFRPSPAQQKALDKLLADQQNPASPQYHKWLTPAQFADRFGMTRNDIQKVVSWLQSQGFTVTRVANSRNWVFFEGTVAEIEAAFHTEIHEYLVGGEVHFANATEPSVPSALAGSALGIHNLHNFQPKPRLHPHFTSHVSGNHFISPGDFAMIYDVQGLYTTGGVDGTGQKIAITGQSAINLTDIANYRSAAGLSANAPTLTLVPGTGTSTTCPGDEGESDLDVEFSGGIAKNATIILVYVGLVSGDTCTRRSFGAFDALQYAIDKIVAPVISNSYGLCEAQIGGSTAASAMQAQAHQANSQGQTIISSSGDSGAADCDFHVTSATQGFAVDMPAAIPEVTGAGGTEFDPTLDPAGTVTGTKPNTNAAATTYWSGTTGFTDTLSSALSYIPEVGWNDTAFDIANKGFISASGGGKSMFFPKPAWQIGVTPRDAHRDVPDISVSASADHDGYLFCSEDGATVPTCSSGFRDSQGNLAVVGGTSAAAPTLAGIITLLDQYLVKNGFLTTPGLGNANPNLYHIATFNSPAFNDVTKGDNMVPCTSGTPDCPTGTTQFGFTAGTGYDQVTGLGSVNATHLATAWADLFTTTTASIAASTPQIVLGHNETFSATVTPSSASGVVSFFANGSSSAFGTATVSGGTGTLNSTALPGGTVSVTATYSGIFANSNASAVQVTVTVPTFSLTPNVSTLTVQPGQSTSNTVNLIVASTDGFVVTNGGNQSTVLPVTYSCVVSPAASEAPACAFSPGGQPTISTSVTNPTVAIVTIAPTAKLLPPFQPRGRIFYAMFLPGVLGIVLAAGSRPRALRVLGLCIVLSFSTLWLGACGGSNSSSQKNPGTPPGSYKVTVNATTTTNSPLITSSATFTVTVQ